MNVSLSETQKALLIAAAEHPAHHLEWFPDGLRGGARSKVLASLQGKGLIASHGGPLTLTAAGFAALGLSAPATPEISDATTSAGAERRRRDHTKQATVIQMLQRPEGATLDQLTEATGWLKHTVRGCLAGALKKKLGLTITSDKAPGGARVYRTT